MVLKNLFQLFKASSDISFLSPDKAQEVKLVFQSKTPQGYECYRFLLNNQPVFGDRLFCKVGLWAPNSGMFIASEWVDTSVPHMQLLLLNVLEQYECTVAWVEGSLVFPEAIQEYGFTYALCQPGSETITIHEAKLTELTEITWQPFDAPGQASTMQMISQRQPSEPQTPAEPAGELPLKISAPTIPAPEEFVSALRAFFCDFPEVFEAGYLFTTTLGDQGSEPHYGLGVRINPSLMTSFQEECVTGLDDILLQFESSLQAPLDTYLMNEDPQFEADVQAVTTPFFKSENKEEFIQAYDENGDILLIHKDDWRTSVLPGSIEKNWETYDGLYRIIAQALEDGFAADVIPAAERLLEIHPDPARSHVLLGIIHLDLGQLDEAEEIFTRYITQFGEEGYILTNLAKVYHRHGNVTRVAETLLRALELNPNQDNALSWHCALVREREEQPAELKELDRLACLPNAWMPQLFLVREYIQQQDLQTARPYIEFLLTRYADEPDVLYTISGCLGQNGFLQEAIDRVYPLYQPDKHDHLVGLNLLQAFLETGNYRDGENLLHQLSLLGFPPLTRPIVHYSNEFMRLKQADMDAQCANAEAPLEFVMVNLQGPLWCKALNNAQWTSEQFAPPKDDIHIAFLALQRIETHTEYGISTQDSEDSITRLNAGLPLYLADAVFYQTRLQVTTLLPMAKGQGLLVYSGLEDSTCFDDLEEICRQLDSRFDYMITGHVEDTAADHNIRLTLWDMAGKQKLATFEATTDTASEADKIQSLETQILEYFHNNVAAQQTLYQPNRIRPLADKYVSAYDQLLSLMCLAKGVIGENNIYGERSMLHYFLSLMNHDPLAHLPKLMMLAGLAFNRQTGSDLYFEFKQPMLKTLEHEKECESPFTLLSPFLMLLFGLVEPFIQRRGELLEKGTPSYRAWLETLLDGPEEDEIP